MESRLQFKVFNFLLKQGLCLERLNSQIRVKIDEGLAAWVQISRKLRIKLECLIMPDIISSQVQENFSFAQPNFFTWKKLEDAENVEDVLVSLNCCVRIFQSCLKAEDNFCGLDVNCGFYEFDKDEFFRKTQSKAGMHFKDFFLIITEENKTNLSDDEHYCKVKCFVKQDNSGYKLFSEESVDLYSKPFGQYIKSLNDRIQDSLINFCLSDSKADLNSSMLFTDTIKNEPESNT